MYAVVSVMEILSAYPTSVQTLAGDSRETRCAAAKAIKVLVSNRLALA